MLDGSLSHRDVAHRARERGFSLSMGYVHNVMAGTAVNPTVQIVRALAAGLSRPESEVFQALGVNLGRESFATEEHHLTLVKAETEREATDDLPVTHPEPNFTQRFEGVMFDYELLTDDARAVVEPKIKELEMAIEDLLDLN